MKEELEVKIYPVNKSKIREKLKSIGAKMIQEETLMRRVIFDNIANPQIKATYARVRDEGSKVSLSLKVHAEKGGNISDQKELELTVNSFDDAKSFLEGVGLIQSNYQETKREIWHYKSSEIVIDTWPALETYIEVEGPSESELKYIVEELDLNWQDKQIVSVDELFAEKYKMSKIDALNAMSFITFEDIPEAFK